MSVVGDNSSSPMKLGPETVRGRRMDGSFAPPAGPTGFTRTEGGYALGNNNVGDNFAAMQGLRAQSNMQTQANYAAVRKLTPEQVVQKNFMDASRMAGNLSNLGQMAVGRQALRNGIGGAYESTMKGQTSNQQSLRQRQALIDQNTANRRAGVNASDIPEITSSDIQVDTSQMDMINDWMKQYGNTFGTK